MTKDTKGVRQVLLKGFKEFTTYSLMAQRSDMPYPETAEGYEKALNGVVDEAERKLQEIMLGMLPEEREVIEPSNPYEYQTRSEQQGWNAALTKVKQNIRGGFNNG